MSCLYPTRAMKTTIILVILSSIFSGCVSATNHTVGGATGWALSSNLQNWSSTTTFFTGDNLEFKYMPTHDVLEVNQGAFSKCQTTSPIRTHNDGDTVISLDQPGTRYFICGTRGHCGSGLKVQVDVLPRPGNSTNPDRRSPGGRRPSSPFRSPPTPSNNMSPPPKTNTPTEPFPFPPPDSPSPSQHSASGAPYHITSLLLIPLITMHFI